MPQSIICPNCSALLDMPDHSAATMRCPYCNTLIIIPEDLRIVILGKGGITYPAPLLDTQPVVPSVTENIASGEDIQVIKIMRTTSDCGL